MKLVDRLSLLMKADAHGVMDQLEERSLLLKQHLREAELELTHKRVRLEAMEEETRRLGEERKRCEKHISSLDADVALALSEDKEDLARFSVRRLLPRRQALRQLRDRIAELEESQTRLREKLEAQECEFEELRSRVRLRLSEARSQAAEGPPAEGIVADEEIELELLRRRGTHDDHHSARAGE